MKGLDEGKRGRHMDGPTSGGGSNQEALSELLDWLNTLLTLLPRVGRIAIAAKARNTSKRAESKGTSDRRC